MSDLTKAQLVEVDFIGSLLTNKETYKAMPTQMIYDDVLFKAQLLHKQFGSNGYEFPLSLDMDRDELIEVSICLYEIITSALLKQNKTK
jgi:hypothetical protein